MRIIKKSLDINLDFKIDFPLEEICFMDIETTGLSKKFHQIYLIGILIYNSKNRLWELIQYFCESSFEEESILKEFMEELKDYKYLITYNGDNFDIAFINEKLRKYNMKGMDIESIDLYKVLRQNRDFICFPNLKLKTVEKELGIHREDTFTGLECIEFYKNYLITKSDHFFNYIIKHNQDDLYSMPKLLKVFQLIKKNRSIIFNFPDKDISLELINIDHSGDLIIINGEWSDSLQIYAEYYHRFYSFDLNRNLDFQIKIEVKKAKLEEGIIAYYVNTPEFNLSKGIKDLSGHNPPNNILILKVHKKNILHNIKNLIREILYNENII